MAALALALWLAVPRDRPAFVDRVEDGRVVLVEGGRTRTVPRAQLPGAREGDVVEGGRVDRKATQRARGKLRRAAKRLRWRAE